MQNTKKGANGMAITYLQGYIKYVLAGLVALTLLGTSTYAAESNPTHVKQASEAVDAIFSGNTEKARELVEAGLPVDTVAKNGFTMLHAAAQEGKGPLVEFLLEKGANPTLKNKYGQTPLYAALDHPSLLPGLVKAGGDVNMANKNGETLLMTAAFTSAPEATKLLLELGADPLKVDANGRNVMFYALMNGKKNTGPIYAMLMERNVPLDLTDKDGETLLMQAVLGRHLDLVDNLLDRGLSLWATNKKGQSVLDMAVIGGGASVVEKLLARNPPKDILQHAFKTSLNKGSYYLVPKLLAAGAEAKDPQLLFLALEGGEWETLRLLLAQGLDPNVKNPKGQRTPLQVAFRNGKPELVRLLLQYGADVSAISEDDLQYGDLLDEDDGKPLLELLIVAGLKPDIQIYGESLSSILQENDEQELLALLKEPHGEGCLAVDSPLTGTRLTDQRKALVGRWQRKDEDDMGELYILAENGQAQREVDVFGVQKTRGTWELRDSHFEFHSVRDGKPNVQRLGVHCIDDDMFIMGNDNESMVFTRVEGEAVLPEESSEPTDTLGPVGDKLTAEQAAKLLAHLQCYARSYTSDEERTAALNIYIESSGIRSQEELMSKLAPFMQDKTFQQNNIMTLMAEMVKCKQNLPNVTSKKAEKSQDEATVDVKQKPEPGIQQNVEKVVDLSKLLRRTWCLYETEANGHNSAEKTNITFMSDGKYDWNAGSVNKTGNWSISETTLELKDVGSFTVMQKDIGVLEFQGTSIWRLKKGVCAQ